MKRIRLSKQESCLLDLSKRSDLTAEAILEFRQHGNGRTPNPCLEETSRLIHTQGGLTSNSRELESQFLSGSCEWPGWRCFVDGLGDEAWIDAKWYALDVLIGWNSGYRAYRKSIAEMGWAPGPNPLGDRHGVLAKKGEDSCA